MACSGNGWVLDAHNWQKKSKIDNHFILTNNQHNKNRQIFYIFFFKKFHKYSKIVYCLFSSAVFPGGFVMNDPVMNSNCICVLAIPTHKIWLCGHFLWRIHSNKLEKKLVNKPVLQYAMLHKRQQHYKQHKNTTEHIIDMHTLNTFFFYQL